VSVYNKEVKTLKTEFGDIEFNELLKVVQRLRDGDMFKIGNSKIQRLLEVRGFTSYSRGKSYLREEGVLRELDEWVGSLKENQCEKAGEKK